MCKRWRFWLGLTINLGSEAGLTTVALALAPLSFIAPLGGLAVVFNAMLAHFGIVVTKERMRRTKGVTFTLRACPHALLDPVAELWAMFAADPVPEAERASTPLFRKASGASISTDDVCAMVRALMASVGEVPTEYGAHSMRIGGATAALAAGVDPSIIKVMGRWDSEVYEIYTRATVQAAATASSLIADTPFDEGPELSEEFDEIVLPGQYEAARALGVLGDFAGNEEDCM